MQELPFPLHLHSGSIKSWFKHQVWLDCMANVKSSPFQVPAIILHAFFTWLKSTQQHAFTPESFVSFSLP